MSITHLSTHSSDACNNDKSVAEDFLDSIIREAGYRRCLILDGNVRDLFPDGKGRHVLLPELLMRRLTDMECNGERCFTICGRWDHIDGLNFPVPIMQQAFERALRCPSSASAPADEYDDGSSAAQASNTNTAGIYTQPQEAFAAMRKLLSHNLERSVFILDWTEHLVGNSSHQDIDERQFLTLLAKAIAEQPVSRTMMPAGLLILVTSNLANLPQVLYKDNPGTKVITVPLPARPQRLEFFSENQRDLQIAEPQELPGRPVCRYARCDTVLGKMADLTDGLTRVDLRNILTLSCQVSTKMRPEQLVNLYKFGVQHSPWEDLDAERLNNVEDELKKRVIGQDHAVAPIANMFVRAYMGLAGLQHSSAGRKPRGTFFFVGPTGVGKTELAKALAAFLFGDENACIRFDMSEYSHEHDDQRLGGAPPSYVGFEQGGQLTNAVRQRPFGVLLFDEIEKAHPRVFDKFLQILEDGRLTDGRGETTYFSETVIIFTSNIGADEADPDRNDAANETYFKEKVSDYFKNPPRADGSGGLGRPELLSRLSKNNITVFRFIKDRNIMRKMLRTKLTALEENLHERFGLTVEISDACIDWLSSHSEIGHGGRDLINIIEHHLINPLAYFLFKRQHQLRQGRGLSADISAGCNAIQFAIHDEADHE